MTVYYSDYVPVAGASGVEGRSVVDLTSTSFADLFAQAANYSASTTYSKGKLAYSQDSIWVYINNTPSLGNAPPTLPAISNTYWELVGTATNSLFTWIAYANSADGITFTDFTTGSSTTGGITRKWIGMAQNKNSAVESSNTADYSWSRFVGEDGIVGANGSNNALVYLYQRSATAPAAPTGTFVFTFSTNSLSGGTPGAWTTTIPANNGNQLWVIAATASSASATDTILGSEFTAPVVLATNGASGTSGLNSASVFLYKRSATVPAVPTTTLTYTFSTATLTGTLDSWTQSIPAGTDPLYVTTATAVSSSTTDTILTSEWAAVRILAQNGTPGTNGAPGTPGANGITYYTWYAYADSADGVVNFTTGVPGNRVYQGMATGKTTATESTTPADYTWAAYAGPPGFGLAATNGAEVSGAKLLNRTGTNWNAQVYSTESYVGGAFVSFKPELNASAGYGGIMIGLNTDPTAADWTTLDYAIYLQPGSGVVEVAESGNLTTIGTYVSTDTFAVHYDGANVRYYKNGVVLRTVVAPPGLRVFLDSAMSSTTTGTLATITSWSAAGSVGATGSAGASGSTGAAGLPAVSGYLTNESIQLFAYANGNVVNYTGATGEFKIFAGNTDVSANFSLATQANPQALTVAYVGRTYTISGGFDANENTATLTIRANGSGTYAGVSIDKVVSLSKAKGGYEIVAALPSTDLFEGRMVFLTTDDKLYRYTGTAWTSAVPAADVAGQLIENQLANGIISESKLKIGVGSNMLMGAIPGLNPNRYIEIGYNPDAVTFTSGGEGGSFLSPAYGTGFPSGYSTWTTPDGGTFAVEQPNNTPNSATPGVVGFTDFQFKYPNNTGGGQSTLWPVEAGKYYEFSAYTGAHRCNVFIWIDWLDAAGNGLGTTSVSSTNANAGQGGTTLGGYDRLVARGQAPAAARNARLVARKYHTLSGQTTSWMFLTHPMWAETTSSATQAMPYNPPPAAILNAEMLVSNSILTRHLKADTIDASHIKADAIRTQHLLVSPNNINPDPLFKDEAFWTFNGSPGWYFEDAPGGSTANTIGYRKYLVLFSGTYTGAAQRTVRSKLIPFSGVGQKLRVRARTINWSNQDLWVYIEFFDGNSQYISGNYTPGSAAGSGVQTLSRQVDVPAGTNFLRVGVANSAGGSAYSGSLVVTDIKVDVAADASLIVDGSIVAGKIAASAVTADTIEAGAVTAAKVGTNEIIAFSGNIKDLTVSTLKIGENAVTVPVTALKTGATSLPSVDGQTTNLVSLSVNPTIYNSVFLSFSSELANLNSTKQYIAQFQVVINGSIQHTSENYTLNTSGQPASVSSWSFSAAFTLPLNSVSTIVLRALAVGTNGGNANSRASNQSIYCLELKR